MKTTRSVLDVSHLPTVVFGHRSATWWAMLGFVLTEALMFAVGIAAYFYVWRNFETWPPQHIAPPDVVLPTIGTLLLLLSMGPAVWIAKAAKRLDRRGLMLASFAAAALGLLILVVRAFELGTALNVRWDTNAYGSVLWLIIGFHTMHVVIDTLETLILGILMVVGPVEEKHFVDASDGADYWYFVVLSWLPLYVLIFLAPRWM